MLGLYTARAEIMSEGKNVTVQQTQFIAIPLMYLLGIILFLFVLLGIALKVLKKVNLKE